ncbi:sporulation protein Cse60 [Haloplasma contractile]|uniref:Uncharacterized protein n=1 Tax=Haloplasma contractile SSD-17B TaxID=1033810 RepID=F7PVX0_9MOLU|nr:sporulation protein Cse60 [Haloplasma contractile]ERJ12706.1 hypothetical protein HLPCO_001046 [Haloplasma contractile SSD-17B]
MMVGHEIKIIEAHTAEDFESKVNTWKKGNPTSEILEIKYNVVAITENTFLYSGLISYKDGQYD